MKKKLKISNFSTERFDKKGLNKISGGAESGFCPILCCCACAYANQGGSNYNDNGAANFAGQLYSPQC